jgi:solute carrier family 25 carnitine/acylcarnitine transporter 20/29
MSNGEFRRILQGGNPNKELSLSEIFIAGSMAGTVMAFFNCPIELLKVKLQTQDPKGVINAKGALEPPVSCCFLYLMMISMATRLFLSFLLSFIV